MRSISLLFSIAISMIVVASILGMINLSDNSNFTSDQNNIREAFANKNTQQGSLLILNHQMKKTFMGNWVVKGQVVNSGTNNINYAIITVDFFDSSGNLLYSGPVNVNDIKSGEKKDFEVNYYGPQNKFSSYRITAKILG